MQKPAPLTTVATLALLLLILLFVAAAFVLPVLPVSSAYAQAPAPIQTQVTQRQLRPDQPITAATVLVYVPSIKTYMNARIDTATLTLTGSGTGPYTLSAVTAPAAPPPATVPTPVRAIIRPTVSSNTISFTESSTGTVQVALMHVYLNGLLLAAPDDYTVALVPGVVTITWAAGGAVSPGDVVQVEYTK